MRTARSRSSSGYLLGRPITRILPRSGVSGNAGTTHFIVLRQDAQVESDRCVLFTSDRVAVRAILRAGFGFPNQAPIVKIATT